MGRALCSSVEDKGGKRKGMEMKLDGEKKGEIEGGGGGGNI